MNFIRIIIIGISIMSLVQSIQAQDFGDIQRYSTPILLNPSFAGSTRGNRHIISLLGTRQKETESHLKFISHDFFIKKKSIGVGYIGGISTNYKQNAFTSFAEIAIAQYLPRANQSYLIPSFTIGIHQPLKEFGLFLFDPVIEPDSVSSPGKSVYRTTEFVTGTGFMAANYDGSIGIVLKLRQPLKKNSNTEKSNGLVYHTLLHAEKIFCYYHRGLLSKQYLIRPRIVFHLGNKTKQLFSELTIQRKNFETGFGFLPNFVTGNVRLSLTFGYNFRYFKLNYLGSVMNDQGNLVHPVHNIQISVIFPELKRYGIPVPALIRSL